MWNHTTDQRIQDKMRSHLVGITKIEEAVQRLKVTFYSGDKFQKNPPEKCIFTIMSRP